MAACALAAPHAASQAAPHPSFCTMGAPPPACATFFVVETDIGARGRGSRGEFALAWQAGLLANRGRSAFGGAAYAAVDLDVRADQPVLNSRLGLLPRYRRWLGRGASLDLSAGPVVELPRGGTARLLTSTDVAVGWADDVALSGRVDVRSGTRPAWFLGVRFGADQVTGVIEAQGVALVLWGLVTLIEKGLGG
jgi:hypothetical protein